MFGKRSFASSKEQRSGKITKQPKRSFRGDVSASKQKHVAAMAETRKDSPMMGEVSPRLISPIVTIVVGPEERMFACHEDVLSGSPFFAELLSSQFFESTNKRINLPNEHPEIFSAVLEQLYKGDYYPRLMNDRTAKRFVLEGSSDPSEAVQPTIFLNGVGEILRDTAIYCAADRYMLEDLKKLALRKQNLATGIEVGTILRSARYAYEHTPEHDSALRAYFLATIIRSRKTFKRSGTMQMEMEIGGRLYFDLFVAMCSYIDDLSEVPHGTPKTI